MDKDINQSLLELILPEGILEYFDIVGFDKVIVESMFMTKL